MIRIYYARITPLLEEETFRQYLPTVNPERQERACSCQSVRARAQRLGVGLLVKQALLEQGIRDDRLVYDDLGKPEPAAGGCHISLSHSGEMAVCAVADQVIGVDIQEKTYREVVLRRLPASVREQLEEADDPSFFFTKWWTEKESRGKLTGRGVRSLEREDDSIWTQTVTIGDYVLTAASCERDEIVLKEIRL